MTDAPQLDPKRCKKCGASNPGAMGTCSVCGRPVCERCGNIQHGQGTKVSTHNDCLSSHTDAFTMIKFVK